jgi:hypothetical protein
MGVPCRNSPWYLPKETVFVTLDTDFLEADAQVLDIAREQMTERSLEAGIKRRDMEGPLIVVERISN